MYNLIHMAGPLVNFSECRPSPTLPSEKIVDWSESSMVEPEGPRPAQAGYRTESPVAVAKSPRRRSTRLSVRNRSPSTTFGYIAVPPRFINNVRHSFRGRVYVSTSLSACKIWTICMVQVKWSYVAHIRRLYISAESARMARSYPKMQFF